MAHEAEVLGVVVKVDQGTPTQEKKGLEEGVSNKVEKREEGRPKGKSYYYNPELA